MKNFVEQNKFKASGVIGDFYFQGEPVWKPNKVPFLKELFSYLIKFNKKFEKELLKTHTPIHTINFSRKLEDVCKAIDLDYSIFENFNYTCPFNSFVHTAFLPTYYFAKDSNVEKLFKEGKLPSYIEHIVMGKKWFIENYYHRDDEALSYLQELKIGKGYTDMCYPNDGSASGESFFVELENGDYIMFYALLWCNK